MDGTLENEQAERRPIAAERSARSQADCHGLPKAATVTPPSLSPKSFLEYKLLTPDDVSHLR
jgi:hypothetical protein